ncbi:MAG: hypothetical protein ACRDTD_08975 [Pseudonocardiaceae bacterium]
MTPWRPVSACPEGHPLPTLPTRWFDGVAWRDGREECRHCYEARAAVDGAQWHCGISGEEAELPAVTS